MVLLAPADGAARLRRWCCSSARPRSKGRSSASDRACTETNQSASDTNQHHATAGYQIDESCRSIQWGSSKSRIAHRLQGNGCVARIQQHIDKRSAQILQLLLLAARGGIGAGGRWGRSAAFLGLQRHMQRQSRQQTTGPNEATQTIAHAEVAHEDAPYRAETQKTIHHLGFAIFESGSSQRKRRCAAGRVRSSSRRLARETQAGTDLRCLLALNTTIQIGPRQDQHTRYELNSAEKSGSYRSLQPLACFRSASAHNRLQQRKARLAAGTRCGPLNRRRALPDTENASKRSEQAGARNTERANDPDRWTDAQPESEAGTRRERGRQ